MLATYSACISGVRISIIWRPSIQISITPNTPPRLQYGECGKDLPPRDRKLATAILQVLHTTPWLEMRDHWGLSGAEMARATAWAMRTLLRDLRSRKGRPLDAEP